MRAFLKPLCLATAGATMLSNYFVQAAEDDVLQRSRIAMPVQPVNDGGISLFSGNSNKPLANEIASYLGQSLGKIEVGKFADGESQIKVLDNVRGKHVYVIQSTSPPVNEHLVELLLMISTLRRASAQTITAVIPYFGYARQNFKMSSRVPISAADVSRLLESMGVDRVIACDLHCGQIQGFFGPNVPVDNLECSIVALKHFANEKLQKPVIVSPDAGGVYRAKKFQSFYGSELKPAGLAMIIKQRYEAGQVGQMNLVGEVRGCDAIIVDDMIDTAGTLCTAAAQLKAHGANKVYAFATHGLFSNQGVKRIHDSPLDQVIVTNTIPLPHENTGDIHRTVKPDEFVSPKIKQISVGLLLAEAIRRSYQRESLNALFNPKSFND